MNYVYSFDPNSQVAAAQVLRYAGRDKKVLEIGAGPGSISRPLKELTGARLTALEVHPPYVARLQEFCDRVVAADLNDHSWPSRHFGDERFEAVVIADVLEHLLEPLETLRAAASLLTDDGAVIVSLPHAGNNAILACLLDADFRTEEAGLLDRTHLRFFCMKNIAQLAADAGLKILDAHFVIRAPERTEFKRQWGALPAPLRKALSAANRYGAVYQVVFKAVALHSPAPAVDLLALPVPGEEPRLFRSRKLARLLGMKRTEAR